MLADSFFRVLESRKYRYVAVTGFFMTLCLIVQQCLSASTNLLASKLSNEIGTDMGFTYFIFYLCSFFAPYLAALPGCYLAKKLEIEVCAYGVWFTTKQLSDKVALSLDNQTASFANSVIGTELPKHSAALGSSLYHLCSAGLNISLNALTIAIAMDADFLVAIIVGLALSAAWVALTHRAVLANADSLQKASRSHSEILGRSFANFASQNLYNSKVWRKKYKQKFAVFLQASLRSEGVNQIVSIVAAILFALPPTLTSIMYFMEYSQSHEKLIALSLIAPRLFLLMNAAHFFISTVVDFSASKRLFSKCMTAFEENTDRATLIDSEHSVPVTKTNVLQTSRIKPDKLHIETKDHSVINVDELIRMVAKGARLGRVTIRGENGAGKSTCLLIIKQMVGQNGLLLSPMLHLEYELEHQGSTAQRFIAQLRELILNSDCEYFLLDEWDAHLDSFWIEKISEEIELLAKYKTVLEIRHRG